jgi:hypothetical protein
MPLPEAESGSLTWSVRQIEEVVPVNETTWVLLSEDTAGR